MKNRITTLAIDLEGTLISNAVSQIPRPGLFMFMEWCNDRVERLVMFTAVPEYKCREIVRTLISEGELPRWAGELEYVQWKGAMKDLAFIHDSRVEEVLLLDDQEAYICDNQIDQWVAVTPFDHPYSDDDTELTRLMQILQTRLG